MGRPKGKKDSARKGFCFWADPHPHESELYHSGCGKDFVFIDGTVKDNYFVFCPFCGGKIVEGKYGTKGAQ